MDEWTTDMNLRDPKCLRVAALLLPLLASGCAVVPDSSVVYHSGHRAPGYSTGYVHGYNATYGYGYPVRPPVTKVYIAPPPPPPPPVIVRPAPAVVLPAHRPPAGNWRGEDRRQGHGHRDGHGGHGRHDGHRDGRDGHGRHDGHRGDHDRGGPGWRGSR